MYGPMKKWKLSVADYQKLQDNQRYGCAICGSLFDEVIDHDHITGKIRGLLCRSCNVGLGFFKDDTERLQNAIDYLNKFKMEV
jgi:hypothetical protein